MEPENLRCLIQGQALDVVDSVLDGSRLGRVVDPGLGQLVVGVQDVRGVKIRQDLHDGLTIVGIGDPAPIVALRHHVVQRGPLSLLEVFQEHLELLGADVAVWLGEGVADVPPQGAKLAPLQDQGVEESEAEEELLEDLGLSAALVPLRLKPQVRPDHHRLQPLRRLHRHLDTVLQDADGEIRVRQCSEPQPEERRHRRRVESLHDPLQHRHIRGGQVAVGQHDPLADLRPLGDGHGGLRALPLAEAHAANIVLHVHASRQVHQLRHRIRSHGQHEDQRHSHLAVRVALLQIKRRRLQVRRPQLVLDHQLDHAHDTVRAEGEQDEPAL
mmetsp:Transcript_95206/g.254550  ORF Transcript_95206/g.254550 Transcript_95206/m.254550 type:complete len:328 (-) Transcript_95206:225-1208(-)